ncbi:MAG: hypothetical protein MJZ60_03260 [Bacteroidaceae bacterium]|nr:hypothetical protein [Bacteroidaceae bacterium]
MKIVRKAYMVPVNCVVELDEDEEFLIGSQIDTETGGDGGNGGISVDPDPTESWDVKGQTIWDNAW